MIHTIFLLLTFTTLLHADVYEPDQDEVACIITSECVPACVPAKDNTIKITNDIQEITQSCIQENIAAPLPAAESKATVTIPHDSCGHCTLDEEIEVTIVEDELDTHNNNETIVIETSQEPQEITVVHKEQTEETQAETAVDTKQEEKNEESDEIQPQIHRPIEKEPITKRKKRASKRIEKTVSENSRAISVENNITPEATSYTHWTGTYTPKFYVQINETQLSEGLNKNVIVENNELTVSYRAKFPYGYSSKDSYVTEIKQTTQTITVDFDWHRKPRVGIVEK